MPENWGAQYRLKAEECREEAARSMTDAERKTWLTMADEWLALARNIEETAVLARSATGAQPHQKST